MCECVDALVAVDEDGWEGVGWATVDVDVW